MILDEQDPAAGELLPAANDGASSTGAEAVGA
jgi:hypothetical protein